jgi:beta-hydroxylase
MVVLYILLGVIGAFMLLLLFAYFFKPELLTLPFSKLVSIFVKNPPVVDKEKFFPESKELEAHWKEIREELIEVLKDDVHIPKFHEVDGIQRFISAKDQVPWRVFGIKAFDKWLEPNVQKTPKTVALLKRMPQVSLAMFSILDAGKRIPRHFGFFRGVFRYHLGLMIPDTSKGGECYIICGGERYDWKEGEGVLFDDTYMHEVWNKTDQRRVVLFLDVLRDNSLPRWLARLNRHMYRKLATSKRVQKAARKAEVVQDIAPEAPGSGNGTAATRGAPVHQG